ncbi:MAG: hypothetical protein ACRCZ2_00345 [Fusobacteriaceae bacterium]
MFLEFYKKFKTNMEEEELFETTSFGKNVLFGFNNVLNEDFDNYIRQKDIVEFNSELEKTVSKLSFIKGFLEYYKQTLEDESKVLDLEIEQINNTASAKGGSFLDLKDRMLDYTKVLTLSTAHLKNIKPIGGVNYKVEEESIKCESYISYPRYDSIILNLKKAQTVNEIIFETHKVCTISIYGETENGDTTLLFGNVESSQRLFVNTKEEKYVKVLIMSNADIKTYMKTFNVYSNSKEGNYVPKFGYIFSNVETQNCKKLSISSDSSSEMFILTKNEFELAIKDIQDKEEDVVSKYLTEKNKIEKNTTINFQTIIHIVYFVEVINKATTSCEEIKIFGKE